MEKFVLILITATLWLMFFSFVVCFFLIIHKGIRDGIKNKAGRNVAYIANTCLWFGNIPITAYMYLSGEYEKVDDVLFSTVMYWGVVFICVVILGFGLSGILQVLEELKR